LAAPFVAGVAALIRSVCPDIDVATLRSALLTGAPMTLPSDKRIATGLRLNAKLALEASLEAWPNCRLGPPGPPVVVLP
jgi:hypothetical protein